MRGALIGDVIGSFWESSRNKNPNIPLWMPTSCFTDDSVCTSAVASWLVDGQPLVKALQQRGRANPSCGFGGIMMAWVLSPNPQPYQSWGNGSAMRVSPVALWADNDDELLLLAQASAMPTHDSQAAICGAQATAWAIRKALEGQPGGGHLARCRTTLRLRRIGRARPGTRTAHPSFRRLMRRYRSFGVGDCRAQRLV